MESNTYLQFIKSLRDDEEFRSEIVKFALKYEIGLVEYVESEPDGKPRGLLTAGKLNEFLKALSENDALNSEFVKLATKYGYERFTSVPANIFLYGATVEEIEILAGKPKPNPLIRPHTSDE